MSKHYNGMPPLTDDEVRQAFANFLIKMPEHLTSDKIQAYYRIFWNCGILDCGGCACTFYTGTGAPCDGNCKLKDVTP